MKKDNFQCSKITNKKECLLKKFNVLFLLISKSIADAEEPQKVENLWIEGIIPKWIVDQEAQHFPFVEYCIFIDFENYK